MKIYYFSDIHLELHKNGTKFLNEFIFPEKQDDILVLAGDIGDPYSKLYKRFLLNMSQSFKLVLVISGNHEYYQVKRLRDPYADRGFEFSRNIFTHTITEVEQEIRNTIKDLPNVIYLNKDEYIYQDIRFLGCVLWSNADMSYKQYMNDFYNIADMNPSTYLNLHHEHKEWLEEKLNETGDFTHTIVITHHLPTFDNIADKYKGSKLNSFYASELEQLVVKANYWIHGHSHSKKESKIGECLVVCNPLGYSSENTGWKKNIFLDI